MQNSGCGLLRVSIQRRFPEDDAVLARFGQCHPPTPPHTVDVVTVNVPRGKQREIYQRRGETPAIKMFMLSNTNTSTVKPLNKGDLGDIEYYVIKSEVSYSEVVRY